MMDNSNDNNISMGHNIDNNILMGHNIDNYDVQLIDNQLFIL